MNLTIHQLLEQVKNALIISVFITCVALMTIGWKRFDPAEGTGFRPKPWTYVYTVNQSSPPVPESTSTTHQQTIPQVRPTALKPKTVVSTSTSQTSTCKNPNVTVLGKQLDICAASEAVKLAEEEDIFVSIKTASVNHVRRLLPDFLTWFQTINPQRVNYA